MAVRHYMYVAAQMGNVDIVKMLLETGAKKQVVDRAGSTPPSLALLNGHVKVAKLLLKNQ